MGELIALIIVGSCGIIMIAAIIIVSIYSSKETYKDEVFAEIIEYEEYATDTYGKMYVAVLKYTYNDKEYIVKDKNRKFRDSDERYKYDMSPYQKTNINIFTWFGIALLIFIVFNLIRYMFV